MNFHTRTYSVAPLAETGNHVRTALNLITPGRTAMTASKSFARCTFRLSCVAALVGLAALGSGCSTPSVTEDAEKRLAEQTEKLNKQNDRTMDITPDWFFTKDEADPAGLVIGRGTAMNNDMQRSIEMATFFARKDVSRKLTEKLSMLTKDYFSVQGSQGASLQDYEQAAQSYMPEVEVGTSRIINKAMVRDGTGFRVFMLVELSYDEAQMQNIAKRAAARLHADLDRRNAEYRAYQRSMMPVAQPPMPPVPAGQSAAPLNGIPADLP